MSTSGLNPAENLCFGANTTSGVSIGFDDAITIDNTKTPTEIYFHGIKVPDTSGTPINFTSLIASTEGFNPSGFLNIGTSNTSEITIGPLKIDNTVVPSQIYINNRAYSPIELSVGHEYTLTEDSTGDKDDLADQVSFINVDGNDIVRVIGKLVTLPIPVDFIDPFGNGPPTATHYTMLELVDGGTYEFNMDINVINAGSLPMWFGNNPSLYLVISSSSTIIDESNIVLDFSSATSQYNKKFNLNAEAGTRVYFDTNVTKGWSSSFSNIGGITILKNGTKISIKRIGD